MAKANKCILFNKPISMGLHISISIYIDANSFYIEFERMIFNHHGVLIHVYRISHQILSDLHSYNFFLSCMTGGSRVMFQIYLLRLQRTTKGIYVFDRNLKQNIIHD